MEILTLESIELCICILKKFLIALFIKQFEKLLLRQQVEILATD
jgi:hypothetical protein